MQCSNAGLLSSGGFGHLNDLNFNNTVFIAQFKAWLPCSELNKCEQSSLYNFHVSSGNLAVSR